MPDTVEVWIVPIINFANDTSIRLRFVGHDCHWTVQPHTLNCFIQKGFGGSRVPSGGQAEIHHLTVCIDSPPKVAPLAADADVSLVHMPINAGAAQVFFCSLGQFRTEFLNPAEYS